MKSIPGMRMFSVYCPRLVTTPRPCRRATSVPTILKGPTGGSSFCVDAARLAPGSLWPCAAITFVSISDCSATSCCQSGSWESAYQSASLRLAAYAASCATRTASRRAISSLPYLTARPRLESRSRTCCSESLAGSHLAVIVRSLPLMSRMPSRFLSGSMNVSKSSIVANGVAKSKALDVPAAAGGGWARAVAAEVRVRESELEVHRLPEALAIVDDDVALDAVDVKGDATHRRSELRRRGGGGRRGSRVERLGRDDRSAEHRTGRGCAGTCSDEKASAREAQLGRFGNRLRLGLGRSRSSRFPHRFTPCIRSRKRGSQ